LHVSKIADNLVDQIWLNRTLPCSKVYLHEVEFAGQSYADKIALCRKSLKDHLTDSMIITAPDSICWLLNLRANDVSYTPLMLGKIIIDIDQVYLFTNLSRIDQEIIDERPDIVILPEEEFAKKLSETKKVLIDNRSASIYITDLLSEKVVECINDPCQLAKARKNNIEISHAINFHIQDAVALCEFFAYLFSLNDLSNTTEHDLGEILANFRSQRDNYVMDSFHTICGFQENSAIIHYRATKTNSKKIIGNGLLLIDSGGQYKGATTDVTRTFTVGAPTKEQKLRYTQVLKGHIALSIIKFPTNVTGANLDVLARQFLWKDNKDYPHGTGHGVGSFLSVHEGPQNISLRSNIPLEPGMILSNEPGYYVTGEFGIRIENLIYVKKVENKDSITQHYLEFDNLTLVPYAKDLIDVQILNFDEKNYLIQYYKKIKHVVYPLLSDKAKAWLEEELSIVTVL
jgi:Xaa-Pro aminopeptidase